MYMCGVIERIFTKQNKLIDEINDCLTKVNGMKSKYFPSNKVLVLLYIYIYRYDTVKYFYMSFESVSQNHHHQLKQPNAQNAARNVQRNFQSV